MPLGVHCAGRSSHWEATYQVREWALPRLNEFCAARGTILTLVDLRSGYVDSDPNVGRVLQVALQEIEQCRYFTCFIGQQMGCYPVDFSESSGGGGGASGDGKPKGGAKVAKVVHERGCTEMEARYVLARRAQWGTRAFFYIRDTRGLDAVNAPVEVAMTSEMQGQRLALINDVGSSGLKLVLDYLSAQDGVESWRYDLERALEIDYPLPKDHDHVPTGVDGWRPNSALELLLDGAHQSFFEARSAGYIESSSCAEVVQAMWDHVHERQGRPLLVTGPPGCGKATALALLLDRYRKEIVEGGSGEESKALVAAVSTRCLHTKPLELLRTLMRMIKQHFKLDAPALPEAEPEILSHGCLFSWLEQGAASAPILLGLDLDGFQDPPGGGTEAHHIEAANMSWLTSAQPAGSNLIVTTAQPSAVATVKDRYHWPIVMMQPLPRAEATSLVQEYLGRRGLEFMGKSREKMEEFRAEDLGNPLFLTTLLHDWRMLDHVVSHSIYYYRSTT